MDWTILEERFKVIANPPGLWTAVRDWLPGPVLVKFEVVEGTWSYAAGTEGCTADGTYSAQLSPVATILGSAPLGALIAKFGGSTAGLKDGTIVLIGVRCTYVLLGPGGAFFLTINGDPKGMQDNSGWVAVRISTCSPAFLYSPGIALTPGPGGGLKGNSSGP